MQKQFVAQLCDAGQVVEYHTYPGKDHVGLVERNSPLVPELMAWTEARFANTPPAETCTTNRS